MQAICAEQGLEHDVTIEEIWVVMLELQLICA